MNIVVLDGYTLNPGDLNWESIESLGSLKVYERTPHELIVARAKGAEVILTNKTPISAETIHQLPDLKYVGVLATGYDQVDLQAAKEKNITVTNIPAYSTTSVAQLTFALLLELCHGVKTHNDAVKEDGAWTKNKDFCFWLKPQIELAGKTLGLIGYGEIGQQVARIAQAMGMNVLVNRRRPPQETETPFSRFEWVTRDELLQRADVVSLHCPLTDETEQMIDRDTLKRMKRSALLINTARGKLINEADLAHALNNDLIAGAGLDVLSVEPPSEDNPLLTAKNCILTPHIAWATKEARQRLMVIATENIKAYTSGEAKNVVHM